MACSSGLKSRCTNQKKEPERGETSSGERKDGKEERRGLRSVSIRKRSHYADETGTEQGRGCRRKVSMSGRTFMIREEGKEKGESKKG